ncbi:MAG: hypothetical protein ABR962_03660 [Candidatus Bathyarchaeia archaeon]|jgi:hypothetical protein
MISIVDCFKVSDKGVPLKVIMSAIILFLRMGHPETSALANRGNLINVLFTERVAWVAHWSL